MTYEEAINELKEYAEVSWGGLAESFECAIEALEKQIPKKPNGKDGYNCGKCGAGLFNNDRYCWKCGRAIDWSSEDGR